MAFELPEPAPLGEVSVPVSLYKVDETVWPLERRKKARRLRTWENYGSMLRALYKKYGATKTPHVFVLEKSEDDFIVKYIGTIDDNYKKESEVTEKYLENAIEALLAGNEPDPATTKAIGCSIKDKNK